jgi:hypothetical protein
MQVPDTVVELEYSPRPARVHLGSCSKGNTSHLRKLQISAQPAHGKPWLLARLQLQPQSLAVFLMLHLA